MSVKGFDLEDVSRRRALVFGEECSRHFDVVFEGKAVISYAYDPFEDEGGWVDPVYLVPSARNAAESFEDMTGHAVYLMFADETLEDTYVILYENKDEAEWPEELCELEAGGAYCYVSSAACPSENGFRWVPLIGMGTENVFVDLDELRIGDRE